MKKYNVAILGATGAVGQEFLRLIEERNFPFNNLKLLASYRSAGKEIAFMGKNYIVEEATETSFKDIDIALFAGGSASKTFAPAAVKQGAVVIDNSSTFRMDPNVPLVIPEVNPDAINNHQGIIANPNCSTIIMLMALKPIYDQAKIKRVVVSTYQAVSGAGKEAIDELTDQVKAVLNEQQPVANILPSASLAKHYPIAFNLIPHIDVFLEDGYTKEEMKMVHETHKIMGDNTIAISPTTVRVPVYRSHSESINIELYNPLSEDDAKTALMNFPGVIVQDDPQEMIYPMPYYTSNLDEVFVGRIRKDPSVAHGLNLWVVGDQIRKGAALNALQIAELMINRNLI